MTALSLKKILLAVVVEKREQKFISREERAVIKSTTVVSVEESVDF